MATSAVLFRVSYGFLAVGGPASTLLLLWLTLPSDDRTGVNIGGGALAMLALVVLALGLLLGLAAAVARRAEHRARTSARPSAGSEGRRAGRSGSRP